MDEVTRYIREGVVKELLYANDLILLGNSWNEVESRNDRWKKALKNHSLKISVNKTKGFYRYTGGKVVRMQTRKLPCSVCGNGVGRNSLQCTKCQYWVHKKCSGIQGKVASINGFVCKRCLGSCFKAHAATWQVDCTESVNKGMEKQIGEIRQILEKLNSRFDIREKKIEDLGQKILHMKSVFSKQILALEKHMEMKADDNSALEEIEKRLQTLERVKKEHQTNSVMQESYDKGLNILIHNLNENPTHPWEKVEETRKIVENFISDRVQIANPSTISFVDLHRLPQRPICRNREKVTRPIIIKLSNAADKRLIYSKLKHLKSCNEKRLLNNPVLAYVTDHLPKNFQKKLLLSLFKEAKKLNKKTYWRAENGKYNLDVNDVKVAQNGTD